MDTSLEWRQANLPLFITDGAEDSKVFLLNAGIQNGSYIDHLPDDLKQIHTSIHDRYFEAYILDQSLAEKIKSVLYEIDKIPYISLTRNEFSSYVNMSPIQKDISSFNTLDM